MCHFSVHTPGILRRPQDTFPSVKSSPLLVSLTRKVMGLGAQVFENNFFNQSPAV